jgi:putative transposase
VSLAELDEDLRAQALQRWRVLRPHLEEGVPLTVAARQPGYRCGRRGDG